MRICIRIKPIPIPLASLNCDTCNYLKLKQTFIIVNSEDLKISILRRWLLRSWLGVVTCFTTVVSKSGSTSRSTLFSHIWGFTYSSLKYTKCYYLHWHHYFSTEREYFFIRINSLHLQSALYKFKFKFKGANSWVWKPRFNNFSFIRTVARCAWSCCTRWTPPPRPRMSYSPPRRSIPYFKKPWW